MAAADLNAVLYAPGRLCIAPTNLALPFPHGGTALGTCGSIEVVHAVGHHDIEAEELGAMVVQSVVTFEAFMLSGVLRDLDADALATIFPNTRTGTLTKAPGIRHWLDAETAGQSSVIRPGSTIAGRGVKLLFSPLDPDRVRGVIFYRALPRVREQAAAAKSFRDPNEQPFIFLAIPDASSRVARDDYLAELSL